MGVVVVAGEETVSEAAATYTLSCNRQRTDWERSLSRISWRASVLAIDVRDVAPEQAQTRAAAALDELAAMVKRVRESIDV